MKTSNELPVSTIFKGNGNLIYFDIDDIDSAEKIETASILFAIDKSSKEDQILCRLNDHLTDDERKDIRARHEKIVAPPHESNTVCIDITDYFHLLLSGVEENKGIVVETGGSPLNYCQLRLNCCCKMDKIIIPCTNESFYEKEQTISTDEGIVASAWILTERCNVISFYIKSLAKKNITVRLQNSPNAKDYVDDAQKLTVSPQETVLIVPYAFSKYMRLVASAEREPIVVKFWFQTQLIPNQCK